MSPEEFREDWTEGEALDAEMAYTKGGGPPSPNSPVSWWHGKRMLRELHAECERHAPIGSPDAMKSVLDAIAVCAMHGWPIPEWAAQPYRYAISRLRHLEARKWDQVFGRPSYLPKGAKIAAEKKRRAIQVRVFQAIETEMRKADRLPKGGNKTEQDMFQNVGSRFHISRTVASTYYYAERATWTARDPKRWPPRAPRREKKKLPRS